jgi:hypothetical protein
LPYVAAAVCLLLLMMMKKKATLHADWSMKIVLDPRTNQHPGIAGEAPPFRDSGLAGGAIFGRNPDWRSIERK